MSIFAQLLAQARRHARHTGEAEDIVQEVLLAAVAAGREDYANPANRRWMAGAIRRRAAFDARSAARRRHREARWQAERSTDQPGDPGPAFQEMLSGLPPSLRVLAALALSGHSRPEILYLLGLSDPALRQRIRQLRKALARSAIPMPIGSPGLGLDLDYGRLRDRMAPMLRVHGGLLASHDPDGHIFLVHGSRKP